MKPYIRIITAALCLILLLSTMASCGVTLKPGENGIYDKQNKISYVHASPVYEAVALVKEYGKLNITSKESLKLYTIPDTDPEKMLATEEGNILYASDHPLPTLTEMAPTKLCVCVDGTATSSAILLYEDADGIAKLTGEYCDGDSIPYPGTQASRRYRVRFESPDYPGFYYTLVYLEYSEDLVIDGENCGRFFFYSIFDGRFRPVSDVIYKALGRE